MAAALKVLAQFNSGGVKYYPGNLIELAKTKDWPEKALEGRLNHKFVEYTNVEEATPAPKVRKPKTGMEVTQPDLTD